MGQEREWEPERRLETEKGTLNLILQILINIGWPLAAAGSDQNEGDRLQKMTDRDQGLVHVRTMPPLEGL